MARKIVSTYLSHTTNRRSASHGLGPLPTLAKLRTSRRPLVPALRPACLYRTVARSQTERRGPRDREAHVLFRSRSIGRESEGDAERFALVRDALKRAVVSATAE